MTEGQLVTCRNSMFVWAAIEMGPAFCTNGSDFRPHEFDHITSSLSEEKKQLGERLCGFTFSTP